jgi:outer membrane protein TolC
VPSSCATLSPAVAAPARRGIASHAASAAPPGRAPIARRLGAPALAAMLAAMLAAAVAACVPPSHEVRAPVDRLVGERLGAEAAPTALGPAQLDALLAKPIDARAAVRIALATSPRLRVAFDQLDIAAADVAAALGLGPVTVDAQLRFTGGHDEYEVDVIQGLLGLVTAPARRAAARAELAAARAAAAAAALRLTARVEIAFDDLLAAQQDAALREAAFAAADAGATLRERMHAAGNTTDLALARDRDAREQARLELSRARAAAVARREAAAAALGLSGSRTWSAAGELRELPAAPPALDALDATAAAASLELAAGRDRRDAAEQRARDERLRSVLPELGVGIAVADDGRGRGAGPALRIGIPLLDPRSGPRARADALVRRADHALEAQRIALAAAARTARAAALATYEEARHLRDVVLPLRQQIVGETVKHYNAMDADPFALIAARQGQVEAAHQYIDALRRYWNAIAEVTALSRGVMLDAPPDAGRREVPDGPDNDGPVSSELPR